ncbi:hypothetical protein N7532_007350 [Penicillium argentinense]|uniref:Altered inheritance of mitochondria protein 41 n=1 Tax=Penicillium argentinense TaxID=1131581 RepID=A0A9W9F7S1_9EURO|nr:uncharacterized protein N7532_007350 [Penicillium argentinense]KAJ5095059.1 hypothetical protein N7532_007350 [Penicillium argentinense]
MFHSLRLSTRAPLRSMRMVRWNSTASPTTPPLMATLRTDLKTAMRAKDTSRLNVLRAVISEFNNSQKTASPIQTDIQLLSLLRKRASAARDAAKEFAEAERPDLKEKEEAQVAVLEEYASQVKTLAVEEVETIIANEITAIKEAGKKLDVGQVLKSLFAPGGALDGKPADRKEVAGLVKKAVSA